MWESRPAAARICAAGGKYRARGTHPESGARVTVQLSADGNVLVTDGISCAGLA